MNLNESLVTSHQRYVLRGQHARGSYEVLRSSVVFFDEFAFLVLRFWKQDKISLMKQNIYQFTGPRSHQLAIIEETTEEIFIPCLGLHWKYVFPPTDPLFLPSGSCNSTPAH